MKMNMSCPLTNGIFGVVGVLIGVLIGHRLAGMRDSAARKRAFVGFLKQWRAEICSPPPIGGYGAPDPSEAAYQARVPSFCAEVERVRDIFSDNHGFSSLTSRLGSLKAEDWQNKQPRDVIVEVIDELIRFVNATKVN
jgi:hypothetical protein